MFDKANLVAVAQNDRQCRKCDESGEFPFIIFADLSKRVIAEAIVFEKPCEGCEVKCHVGEVIGES